MSFTIKIYTKVLGLTSVLKYEDYLGSKAGALYRAKELKQIYSKLSTLPVHSAIILDLI